MARLRLVGVLGLAAAAVYLLTTAAGSVLNPTYSQLRQHVSDLTATGAPTTAVLWTPYALYNLLVVAFGVALFSASDRSGPFKAGLALLGLNALAGVMMVTWFREDLGGSPSTLAGVGHIVFASVSSLAIVGLVFVFGVGFRRVEVWRGLSPFSFAAGAAFLILGPLAVVATRTHTLAGLAERGPIGVFIVWLVVVSLRALRAPAPPA